MFENVVKSIAYGSFVVLSLLIFKSEPFFLANGYVESTDGIIISNTILFVFCMHSAMKLIESILKLIEIKKGQQKNT